MKWNGYTSRCPWCLNHPLYQAYHDEEWGVPVYDNQTLFEFLILEGMQAGLSWITILKKRASFREAFLQFDPDKIARFDQKKIEELMGNAGIIRNRLKIESVIKNARAYLAIQDKDDFAQLIWQFVDGKPKINYFESMKQVPAKTEVSDHLSKYLKQHGFSFVGSTICYAYMQAVGMVNDHLVSCYRHSQLQG